MVLDESAQDKLIWALLAYVRYSCKSLRRELSKHTHVWFQSRELYGRFVLPKGLNFPVISHQTTSFSEGLTL